MKKIISCFLVLILLSVSVMASEEREWENLTRIENLLTHCDELGINTCYEEVNYNILNRFVRYYSEDEENGVSQERLDYNNECLTNM